MEPHQSIDVREIKLISRDESLIVTRIDLGQRVRLRSIITLSMTLSQKQGVSTLKHKRKQVVVETRTLIVTQTLGGLVVSALQQEDPKGLTMLPVVSLPAVQGEPNYTELISLALLRQDELPGLPEKVQEDQVQAALADARREAQEGERPARRKRETPAAPAPAGDSGDEEESPF